ncbi:MAG: RluA family pseudouridine synthase [Tissierellales bacterium]|nr:RluA family pseudouridine synthase [Tissierellales bacterium]
MKEIIVGNNENQQRLDRFLKKYFSEASLSFIYKMIRKKNIKVNNKKASPELVIYTGDKIQIYLSDDLINKLTKDEEKALKSFKIDICYEDENILLINKPAGKLSHSSSEKYEENVVDDILSYLIYKKEYVPRIEKTFTPSICNRLDRNTTGLIISAKNYKTLKSINFAIKEKKITKYYKTIVSGRVKNDFVKSSYLFKNEEKNKSKIYDDYVEGSKKIETIFKVLKTSDDFSILEVNLITGRSHQIRAQLSDLGYPIIGDRKYGNKSINQYFEKRYGLNYQLLHAYKLKFDGLDGDLSYLNGRCFTAPDPDIFNRITKDLFIGDE